MPRLTKSVPKYRKHRASGQAVVVLNRQDFYLGPHGTRTSRREYDRLIAEWLANGRRLPGGAEQEGVSVAELLAGYWQYPKGYYRKNGEATDTLSHVKVALRFLKAGYSHTQAADFGPLAFKAVPREDGRRWTQPGLRQPPDGTRRPAVQVGRRK